MATLKDIAKICNVSTATVSLVLNHKPIRVSPSVRELILKTAKDLDYKPNLMAKSLSVGKSNVIGLIIPDIKNNHFANIIAEVEECLSPENFQIMLGNSNDEAKNDIAYIGSFLSYNVDGFIIIISSNHTDTTIQELISLLSKSKKPVTFIDRKSNSEYFSNYTSNNELGGYLATKHLLSLGHKKIGCLMGPMNLISSIERFQGYKRALEEFHIKFNPSLCFEGNYKIHSGIAAFPYFYKQKTTAIFASNDIMALGLYHAAYTHNVHIPTDISIIGFDNIDLSRLLYPTLSSIAQPMDKIVRQSCQLLTENINNKTNKIENLIFEPKLIIRNSSYPPKKIE